MPRCRGADRVDPRRLIKLTELHNKRDGQGSKSEASGSVAGKSDTQPEEDHQRPERIAGVLIKDSGKQTREFTGGDTDSNHAEGKRGVQEPVSRKNYL